MAGGIGELFPAHSHRLMQLFEEYGDKLFASGDDSGSSNSSALTNLTYFFIKRVHNNFGKSHGLLVELRLVV
ncbi:MAG TPA: hypothetical protein VN456_10730 [Desulfosporosinus sp.]|nr:hypothetical protein [Desulfosporosinus sp.]